MTKSNAAAPHEAPHAKLRRDLVSHSIPDSRRAYRMVIDEIGGRFARVSEHIWQSLQHGEADEMVWQSAQAAGWTRSRDTTATPRFHPLYIRFRFGSVDTLAARFAPWTGWLFAPLAIMIWSLIIGCAVVLVASQGARFGAFLGSLPQFFQQTNPLLVGAIFVLTKLLHELGHAVACRRVGSRCGSVGVLFLCGMPCPYCDVTDVWRQRETWKRVFVMLAGIYVELILASLATFCWLLTSDPVLRFHALNVMIVCGVSTVLFNANPLMRYDGYYVLADLLGSTQLRVESSEAFAAVCMAPLAGTDYGIARRCDRRSFGLAIYHGLATIYRCFIFLAIAALLMQLAGYLAIRPLAVPVILLAVGMLLVRSVKRLVNVANGGGRWTRVPRFRRWSVLAGLVILIAFVLLVPLPRYRRVTGWMDVANAQPIYLDHAGMIDEVRADFGDRVSAGDLLVRLQNDHLAIQQARLSGQLRMASLRRDLARRVSLDRNESAQQWNTLEAAEKAVAMRLATVRGRLQKSSVTAPIDGILLPPDPVADADRPITLSLRRRVGTVADAYQCWCRISPDGAMQTVLILDASDRANLDIGTSVRVYRNSVPSNVFASIIESMSAIQQDSVSVARQARYQVTCSVPMTNDQCALEWLGTKCTAVFQLPARSVASDVIDWLRRWVSGEMT